MLKIIQQHFHIYGVKDQGAEGQSREEHHGEDQPLFLVLAGDANAYGVD
jgi:hypothetical protein